MTGSTRVSADDVKSDSETGAIDELLASKNERTSEALKVSVRGRWYVNKLDVHAFVMDTERLARRVRRP
jgi:hypothetical protein